MTMIENEFTLEDAPIGTKAPCAGGGAWCKTAKGWKWNGPGGHGSTFPRPGAEWDGRLLPPSGTLSRAPALPVPADPQANAKALAAGLQMPTATAMALITAASWARSYSVSNLDALELVREVERYYGRTESAPA
ncbi:hypothetical protein [Acidovorax sp. PRC11]|uniref:hypothetical protein n=1 Tax=Acidovorax sp. PRC11 TaxID=2962592 RepID=UPI0028822BF1|nr:hypothetical protein [Acidovorax sp. PRC11]MDT0138062.1 hypothetical protein [Acidovorax sp. PRC11]